MRTAAVQLQAMIHRIFFLRQWFCFLLSQQYQFLPLSSSWLAVYFLFYLVSNNFWLFFLLFALLLIAIWYWKNIIFLSTNRIGSVSCSKVTLENIYSFKWTALILVIIIITSLQRKQTQKWARTATEMCFSLKQQKICHGLASSLMAFGSTIGERVCSVHFCFLTFYLTNCL